MSLQPAPQSPLPAPASGVPGGDVRARVCASLQAALAEARNADGGWPYLAGRRSRIEPTCWSLLALARMEGRQPDTAVLRAWPRQDGWLREVPGVAPNHAFNALAALVFERADATRPLADAIAARVVAVKGVRVRQGPEMRQDNSLQAWSWLEGTFSWVEPTALCLLLLKHRRARRAAMLPEEQERIAVGEQMLLDRVCRAGGWNYGNSNVFGQDLWPYVPTTALALLAMQDRRADPAVARSAQRLRAEAESERSASSLALSVICLRVFGESVAPAENTLLTHLDTAGHDQPADVNLMGLAMALYALTDVERPAAPFALAG